MAIPLTDTEKDILRRIQGDLPDSATPFADIARLVGVDEETVLELLARLKDEGVIRRLGATLRHQKAGYGANAMVAWHVDEDDIDRVGQLFAARPEISHCYVRTNCLEWPYNFYTMVHGKSREECLATIEAIAREVGVDDYSALLSLKEIKKTSMQYF